MKSVLDRTFAYTPAVETDIKKTFARIRRRMKEQEQQKLQAGVEAKAKVSPIKPAGKIVVAV